VSTSDPTTPDIGRLRAASEWVQRLHESNEQSIADQWLEWCQSDPSNLAAFEQMQRIWLAFPDVQDRCLHAPATGDHSKHPRGLILLAASIVLGVGLIAWLISRPMIQVIDTSIGELRHINLSDGSRIDLAPDSRVVTRLTLTRREVQLERGQAFFAVGHSALRPFVVQVANLTVTTLGTAFDVRTGPNNTVVVVSEGRVSIVPSPAKTADNASVASEAMRAGAGQRVTYSRFGRRLSMVRTDSDGAGSWRNGTLQFVSEPLEDVVSAINRYSSRHVVVSAAYKATRFTGTLSPPNIREWLSALEQIYDVKVVDQGSNGILIRSRTEDGGKK
jgi:transmembrane sensor